jgi:hypothetical protein
MNYFWWWMATQVRHVSICSAELGIEFQALG